MANADPYQHDSSAPTTFLFDRPVVVVFINYGVNITGKYCDIIQKPQQEPEVIGVKWFAKKVRRGQQTEMSFGSSDWHKRNVSLITRRMNLFSLSIHENVLQNSFPSSNPANYHSHLSALPFNGFRTNNVSITRWTSFTDDDQKYNIYYKSSS